LQAVLIKKQKKILVLGTGGTIAGLRSIARAESAGPAGDLAYTAAKLGIDALLAWPRLAGLPVRLVAEQVMQMDSKDMDETAWRHLARRCIQGLCAPDVDGIVITHGTDTLEETSFFLHLALAAWSGGSSGAMPKPLVMTCAMRPADSPYADGPANLRDAICVAASESVKAGVPAPYGVVVACGGRIHAGWAVQKVHPTRLDAFDSGDAELLGRITEQGVRWSGTAELDASNWLLGQAEYAEAAMKFISSELPLPRVDIVLSHAGADVGLVDALLTQRQRRGAGEAAQDAVQGIVVAATGNGTLHHRLIAALSQAQAAGIRIWVTTRCAYGQVAELTSMPFEAVGLPPVKARIALQLALLSASQISSTAPQRPWP
jgi:L-asparaginase